MWRSSFFVIFSAALMFFVASAGAQESPETVDGATTIDAHQAKSLYDSGVQFIDVRSEELWEESHIPGAHFMELFTTFSDENLLKVAAKSDEVVMYCAGPSCKRSSKACAKAVSWGFEKVYYFRGGFPEWQAAGYPTDPP